MLWRGSDGENEGSQGDGAHREAAAAALRQRAELGQEECNSRLKHYAIKYAPRVDARMMLLVMFCCWQAQRDRLRWHVADAWRSCAHRQLQDL
jgi:hypothetical protein